MKAFNCRKWTARLTGGLLAGAVFLALGAGSAWGHGRVHFGFGFGHGPWPGFWDPWFGPYWHGPVFYHTLPPPVIIQQAPPVYIERAPEPQAYWYYCAGARGYYPRVKTCPGGWTPVLPDPQ